MSNEADSRRASLAFRYLVAIGKARGFVTYDEINDNMPESVESEEEIDAWLSDLADEGIEVVHTFEPREDDA